MKGMACLKGNLLLYFKGNRGGSRTKTVYGCRPGIRIST